MARKTRIGIILEKIGARPMSSEALYHETISQKILEMQKKLDPTAFSSKKSKKE